jgi:hypothetical protein
MTIVTVVSGCAYAYSGDCTRDGGGRGGRWVRGSACHATCSSPPSDSSGRSMSLPFLITSGTDQRDEVGCVDGTPPGLC